MLISENKYVFEKFMKTTVLNLFFFFATYAYLFLLSPYLDTLGWSEWLKGMFFALFALVGILLAPIIGSLSDSIGRFKVLLAGICLEIFALIGYLSFQSPGAIIIIRIISAIAFNAVTISALSRINDLSETKIRGRNNGLFQSITALAVIISPYIGGVIADAYNYQAVFLFSLIIMISSMISLLIYDMLFFKYNKHRREHRILRKKDMNPLLQVKKLIVNKELRPCVYIEGLIGFTIPFFVSVLPLIVLQEMGLSNSYLGLFILIKGIFFLLRYQMGYLLDRYGEKKTLFLGVSLLFISFLGFSFLTVSVYMVSFLIALNATGISFIILALLSIISEIGKKHNIEGRLVGAFSSVNRITSTIGFLLTGAALQAGFNVPLLYSIILLPAVFLSLKIIKGN